MNEIKNRITEDTRLPSVSVVVPVYKVEKYLRQCIDSILAQTLKNIEVILVDDGSPDACPAIIDEYAAIDSRIIAIHQSNGGYGKAVNVGIAAATAPYIGIVESDDWIEATMYEKLYTKAQQTKADMIKCGHYIYNSLLPEGKKSTPWCYPHIDITKAPEHAFHINDWPQITLFHTGPWSWLYRAEVLKSIPFIETQGAAYQDIPFMFEMLARNPKMAAVKNFLVHYRNEPDSGASSTRKDAGLLRMPDMTLKAMNILNDYNMLEPLQEEFFFHAFGTHVPLLEQINKKYRQEYFEKTHLIFKHLQKSETFQAKYFRKKQLKQLQLLINGGNANRLFRRWRFSFKKGRFYIRLAGIDICK